MPSLFDKSFDSGLSQPKLTDDDIEARPGVPGKSLLTIGRPEAAVVDVRKSPAGAFKKGLETGFTTIGRGIKQLAGMQSEEDLREQEEYMTLEKDPGLSRYLKTGEFIGSLFEPVTTALILAGGAGLGAKFAKLGASAETPKVLKGLLSSKTAGRAALGAGTGLAFGGLSEVREGESRTEKALTGALASGILTPALGKAGDVLVSKFTKGKANVPIDLPAETPAGAQPAPGPNLGTGAAAVDAGVSGRSSDPVDDVWKLITAVESGGDHWADKRAAIPKVSPAGAVGIAQVMPETGPEAAKLAGLPWDKNKFLYSPQYNEALGKAYFRRNLELFDGDVMKAAAAYNAGPGAVKRAVEKHADNWLSAMPRETVNYVVKLGLFGNTPDLAASGRAIVRPISKTHGTVQARHPFNAEYSQEYAFELDDPSSFQRAAKTAMLTDDETDTAWIHFQKVRAGITEPVPAVSGDKTLMFPTAAADDEALGASVGDIGGIGGSPPGALPGGGLGGTVPPSAPVVRSFPERVEQVLGVELPSKSPIDPFHVPAVDIRKFQFSDDVENAVRSVAADISNKQVSMQQLGIMAGLEDLNPDNIVEKLGDFAVSPMTVAARAVTRKAAIDYQDKVRNYVANMDSLPDDAALEMLKETVKFSNIYKVSSNVASELARSLRALQEPVKLFNFDEVQEILRKTGGVDGIKEAMKLAAAAPDVESAQQLAKAIADPSLIHKLAYVFMNNLISSGSTVAKNTFGSLFSTLMHLPERTTEIALGKLPGMKPLPGETPATFTSLVPRWAMMKAMIPEAFSAMGKGLALDLQQTKFMESGGSPLAKNTPLNIALRTVAMGEYPMRLSAGIDGVFQVANYYISAAEQLSDLAVAKGLRGREIGLFIDKNIRKLPSEMITRAVEDAQERTFTNPAGSISKHFIALAQDHPSTRFIAPFIKTLGNLIKYGLKRLPTGLAFKETRNALMKGGLARNREIGKMAIGSAMTYALYDAAQEGKVTGVGPRDPDELRAKIATGWRPVSIKIDGVYYPVQGMEPFSTYVGLAGSAAEMKGRVPDSDIEDLLFDASYILAKNIESKSMFMGVANLSAALNDPERYGERYLQQQVQALIPTVARHWRWDVDNDIREATTFLEYLQGALPYQSQDLPVSYNSWGEIKERNTLGLAVLSPFQASPETLDPIKIEAARIGFIPPRPVKNLNGTELSAEERSFHAGYSGQLAKKYISANMGMPGWHAHDEETKKKIFERSFETARKIATERIKRHSPERFERKNPPEPLPYVRRDRFK